MLQGVTNEAPICISEGAACVCLVSDHGSWTGALGKRDVAAAEVYGHATFYSSSAE